MRGGSTHEIRRGDTPVAAGDCDALGAAANVPSTPTREPATHSARASRETREAGEGGDGVGSTRAPSPSIYPGGITPRQRQVLDAMRALHAKRGRMPTMLQIQQAIGIRSNSHFYFVIDKLVEAGALKRQPPLVFAEDRAMKKRRRKILEAKVLKSSAPCESTEFGFVTPAQSEWLSETTARTTPPSVSRPRCHESHIHSAFGDISSSTDNFVKVTFEHGYRA